MTRTVTAAIVAGLLTFCAVLFALTAPTAPASAEAAPAPVVAEAETTPPPVQIATVYGDDDASIESDGPDAVTPEGDAVPSDAQGTDGAGTAEDTADQSPTAPAEDTAPEATDRADAEAAPAEDVDPDALPADAPRVCIILDMGAAACDAFVNPLPGEVSVAIIYSDDDEHAIVETIAYDSNGPIDYVDFWEADVTPSE